MAFTRLFAVSCVALGLMTGETRSADWPRWGRDASRNMVSAEKSLEMDLPTSFDFGRKKGGSDEIDPATTKNVKWVIKLGSSTLGNPVLAGGKIFLGTNNEPPHDAKIAGDRSVLLCLDAASGKFLWQLACPKLPGGMFIDFESAGLCCSPTIDHSPAGDRVYIISNRCEVLCLTADGLAKGNQGPFKDESRYLGAEAGATDGDIIWRYDMAAELGVRQLFQSAGSVLIVGDRLYAMTSNGRDLNNGNIPAPDAPALICLDKQTGKLLGREKSGVCQRLDFANWSSPAFGKAGDRDLLIFGGGDGFCYGFDPTPADGVLKELWRCDCNPPEYRTRDGKPIKWVNKTGPSEIIATPVLYDGRVYVTIGQESASGDGVGCLSCIDAANGKIIWQFKDIRRSISTATVTGGLVFAADLTGALYCLDAATGKLHWTHNAACETWASPMVACGRIYLGGEGKMTVIEAAAKKHLLAEIDVPGKIICTPIVADGVMYIATDTHLYAIANVK